MCVGPDGSRSGKSRPALVHLGKKILKWKALSPFLAKNEWQQRVQLETNATFFDEMWVSCSRTERKSINCRIVFVVIPRAPVYRVVFKKKKIRIFLTLKIHTIKCVMTVLGRAGWEIFGSRSWHSDLCVVLGPYVMTSSQIFSRPALPLSQLVNSISQRL